MGEQTRQDQHSIDATQFAALGGIIRHIRRQRDLSQRDLAKLTGLAPSTVAGVESGARQPSLNLLQLLLQATGMRLAVLDEHGAEVGPMRDDVPRTNGGNRYPAHLDARIPTTSPFLSTIGLGVHPERSPRVLWYSMRPARDRQRWLRPRPADHPSRAEYLQAKIDHWPDGRGSRAV